jgi:hypothetical protein
MRFERIHWQGSSVFDLRIILLILAWLNLRYPQVFRSGEEFAGEGARAT